MKKKKKKEKKKKGGGFAAPVTTHSKVVLDFSIQLPYRTNRLLHNHFFLSLSSFQRITLHLIYCTFFLFSFFFFPLFFFSSLFAFTTTNKKRKKEKEENKIKKERKKEEGDLPSGFRERLPDSGSAYRVAAALEITASASPNTRKPSNTAAQLFLSS